MVYDAEYEIKLQNEDRQVVVTQLAGLLTQGRQDHNISMEPTSSSSP